MDKYIDYVKVCIEIALSGKNFTRNTRRPNQPEFNVKQLYISIRIEFYNKSIMERLRTYVR